MLIKHPDKNKDNIQQAEEYTKAIVEAYTILSNPQSRHRYDEYLKSISMYHSRFSFISEASFKESKLNSSLLLLKKKPIDSLCENDKKIVITQFFYTLSLKLRFPFDWLSSYMWRFHVAPPSNVMKILNFLYNFNSYPPLNILTNPLGFKIADYEQFEKLFTLELLLEMETWSKYVGYSSKTLQDQIGKMILELKIVYDIYYSNSEKSNHVLADLCNDPMSHIIEIESDFFFEQCKTIFAINGQRETPPSSDKITTQLTDLIKEFPRVSELIPIIECAKDSILNPEPGEVGFRVNKENVEKTELIMKLACEKLLSKTKSQNMS